MASQGDLFVRPDGRSMVFLMSPAVRERIQVKAEVERRGGVVVENVSPGNHDHVIRLLARTELKISRSYDMFQHSYVLDCIKADRILPNLKEYKVVLHTMPSPYAEYDPLEVLMGSKRWSEVPTAGEVVSDIEDVQEEEGAVRAAAQYKAFKSGRTAYTDEERKEIVQALVKRRAYRLVKGNTVWQSLDKEGLCRDNRTWQSMKEQFRKVSLV